jgi:hypothetical protein
MVGVFRVEPSLGLALTDPPFQPTGLFSSFVSSASRRFCLLLHQTLGFVFNLPGSQVLHPLPVVRRKTGYAPTSGTIAFPHQSTWRPLVIILLAPVIPTTVVTMQSPDIRKASEAEIEVLNTESASVSHPFPFLFFILTLDSTTNP